MFAAARKSLIAFSVLAAVQIASAVPRPWTPVKADDGRISVCGREYTFASNALPVSVKSLGRQLLSAPIRVVATDGDGKDVVWTKHGSWVHERTDESATVCGWSESAEITVDTVTRIDYDGMMEVSFAVVPGPKRQRASVSRLWLEIPLEAARTRYYQYYPFPWGKCENAGAVKTAKIWPFLASVWLGDEQAGFCWFCESERGFANSDERRVIEVQPGARATILRIRLVDELVELPRTWVFGLEATPAKPYDRSWNRNHVLHSPPMGVGITIKRPEIWWTAQRAFPNGGVEEALDKAALAGVKTVAFHEDWIPIQNNPMSARPDFKALVDGCHRRGMKAIVYDGYELSPLDPEWGRHHGDWLANDEKGRPAGFWYRPPAQRDYRSCLASGFADKWVERAKRAYETLGIDGFYLDGTICPWKCCNERHGCGWRNEKGELKPTYAIFSIRKAMRELYEFVDSKGGVINAHQSGYTCPATLGFVHSYWDGEQLATSTSLDIRKELDLDKFRAEFMGRNHGVPCEFLAYEIPGKWCYEDALALTLIHDVPVRPCGFGSEARLAPIWKAMDRFGVTEAKWLPYWEKPMAVEPDSVKASVYEKDGRRLAVVANLSADSAVTASLDLDGKPAADALTGERIPEKDGKAMLKLEPFRMRLVEY